MDAGRVREHHHPVGCRTGAHHRAVSLLLRRARGGARRRSCHTRGAAAERRSGRGEPAVEHVLLLRLVVRGAALPWRRGRREPPRLGPRLRGECQHRARRRDAEAAAPRGGRGLPRELRRVHRGAGWRGDARERRHAPPAAAASGGRRQGVGGRDDSPRPQRLAGRRQRLERRGVGGRGVGRRGRRAAAASKRELPARRLLGASG
mmetsp:Transcript_33243/g.109565  ORF Transcript_33243/g.109565 Transcript_33243/m.109565 type:complete len:205 (-) Transcript_33243:339-953(-)